VPDRNWSSGMTGQFEVTPEPFYKKCGITKDFALLPPGATKSPLVYLAEPLLEDDYHGYRHHNRGIRMENGVAITAGEKN